MLYSIFFMIEALSIFNYSFMVGDAAVTALKQLQLKPVNKTFYKKWGETFDYVSSFYLTLISCSSSFLHALQQNGAHAVKASLFVKNFVCGQGI